MPFIAIMENNTFKVDIKSINSKNKGLAPLGLCSLKFYVFLNTFNKELT